MTIKIEDTGILANDLLEHIKALASEEFAGRQPGTVGEQKTLDYFEQYFKDLEKKHGSSYELERQAVPVKRLNSKAHVEILPANASPTSLIAPTDFVAGTKRFEQTIKVTDRDIVFVGYGIEAPEYGWDDYKGLDVSGKILLMLVGDPILPDASSPTGIDQSMFRGRELTYYGRWTYKYEIAGAKGAAAVFVIHETDRAGYGWDVVAQSFGQEDFVLADENPTSHSQIEGWLSRDAASRLFEQAGANYESAKGAALSKQFKPIELNAKLSATVQSESEDLKSHNLVAVQRGTGTLFDESIIYTAHWDHFGTTSQGTKSGAIDNASGCAGVLAMAKAFSAQRALPRSIVYFLPTLEEENLLGSRYYVRHPALPIEKTLAVLNFEMLNPWGRSTEISSVCKGHTSLDELLARSAAKLGKNVVPDPEPEKGYVYRSDHLPFMQAGVPALALFFSCMNHLDRRKSYITTDYHKVTDKPRPDWNLSGAAEDAWLLYDVGLQLLTTGYRAAWNPKSEFAR